jgi:peptidyl-prolyl cis-trans isomerase C
LPKEALEDQIKERLEARKLHQGKRELKDELLEKYKVQDKMAEHLGPDPQRRPPKQQKPGGEGAAKVAPSVPEPAAGDDADDQAAADGDEPVEK